MLEPGARFHSYEILGLIGSGGMGEVYLARDLQLKRDVALKVLPESFADDQDRLNRFRREAETLASLNHRYIASIYTLVESGGRSGIAMEFIEGETLADRLGRGTLPGRDAIRIAEQIAEALAAAHEKGIVHRDVKPANVKIAPDGTAKVLDFGLAKSVAGPHVETEPGVQVVGGTSDTAITLTEMPTSPGAGTSVGEVFVTSGGAMLGTIAYMSPEQANGGALGPASDMYSLGLVLREMITGCGVYDPSLTREQVTDRARCGDIPALPAMDRDIAALIRRLTSLSPTMRPTAVETVGLLRWIAGKNRRRLVRAGIAAAVLLLVGAGTKYTLDVTRERDRAAREAEVSRQVTDFMVGLFRVPDPGEARGRSVTARELLDNGAKTISESLQQQPEIQARLLQTMADSFQGLGLYEEAQRQLERTLSLRINVLGRNDADTVQTISALATVNVLRQDYKAAQSLYEQVLATELASLGPLDPMRLSAMQDLGWLLARSGRHEDGERMVRTALAEERRQLGNEHPNTMLGLNRLANVLGWQERLAEREDLLKEELELRRRVQGPDHPRTIMAMRLLGGTYQDEGRNREAEEVLREVKDMTVKELGPNHPQTAAAMNDLGWVLDRLKRFGEAEQLFRSAIDINRLALGAEADSTLLSVNNLGVLYMNSHRYQEADETFAPLLETSRRVRGTQHQRTLDILNNLAIVRANEHRFAEARAMMNEALATARSIDQKHPRLPMYTLSLAEIVTLEGRRDEAISLLSDAVGAGLRENLSEDEYLAPLRSDPRFQQLAHQATNAPASAAQR